jgi:hypothetical protein
MWSIAAANLARFVLSLVIEPEKSNSITTSLLSGPIAATFGASPPATSASSIASVPTARPVGATRLIRPPVLRSVVCKSVNKRNLSPCHPIRGSDCR